MGKVFKNETILLDQMFTNDKLQTGRKSGDKLDKNVRWASQQGEIIYVQEGVGTIAALTLQ